MDGFLQRPEGWEEVDYKVVHTLLDTSQENILIKTPEKYTPEYLKKLQEYDQDTILVLAGGLNEYNKNHQWVIRRLDLALALYRQKPRKIICLGGGTYHKPPCQNHLGYVIHESTACAQYLLDQGVDPKDLTREWSSYDTIANAFFSLLNFAIPLQLKDILVITSDFHMPRTKAIFHWIYSLTNNHDLTNLGFLSVNSRDLDENIIKVRLQREKQSLLNLKDKIRKIRTLEEFHQWFFTEHKAYNCDFEHLTKQNLNDVDEDTKSSY